MRDFAHGADGKLCRLAEYRIGRHVRNRWMIVRGWFEAKRYLLKRTSVGVGVVALLLVAIARLL